ncbi:MAG: polyamine aminopropyltransferase [Eubacteriales bacterium]|nr:polyamine aminopropyltransferase [Eubacteriales bacterium]MDD4541376.1 polyamine aminopropyltransferase [Eubacteriales bacterium]
MELWFEEHNTDDVHFALRVKKQLFSQKSDFQQIDIYDTYEFGRVLVMDGAIMLTEKDEFIYHEMIVHVAMAVHPEVKKVLLIGGGDGGALRELCRYPGIEQIEMVEIDPLVVDVAKEYLPAVASAFSDERLNLIFADGLRYVRHLKREYDLLIIDSTDPFGPGESLFTREFYGNCSKGLREGGILINQHESPYYKNDAQEAHSIFSKTSKIFSTARVYQAHIPTYPSGHWLFGFMSNCWDPIKDHDPERWEGFGLKTRYYNSDLHKGAFSLPTYVRELLTEGRLIDD